MINHNAQKLSDCKIHYMNCNKRLIMQCILAFRSNLTYFNIGLIFEYDFLTCKTQFREKLCHI